MIDINLKDFPHEGIDSISLLILHDDLNWYCAETKEWANILHKIHKNSFKINFSELFLCLGTKGLQDYITNFINQHNINVIYFAMPFSAEFDLTFIEKLRNRVYIVMYFDDMALFFNDTFRYLSQSVDLVLSHDYIEKYRFELYGTRSLFFPMFDPMVVDYSYDVEKKDIEVSFLGRVDRVGRKEFLEFLDNNNIGMQIYGDGTKNGIVSKQQKIDILGRSKIGLNFSGCAEYIHKRGNKIDKRIKQAKGRLWELAFTKSLVMTEYAPGLEKSFNIGEEIVIFEDKYDLLEKIKFYQKNDDLRKEIAIKGYQRAIRDCNPVEVCNNLLQLIYKYSKEKKYRPSEIIFDDDYLKSVSKHRAIYAVRFMKQKKYRLALEELKLVIRSKKFNFLEILLTVFREVFRPIVNNNPRLRQIVAKIRALKNISKEVKLVF